MHLKIICFFLVLSVFMTVFRLASLTKIKDRRLSLTKVKNWVCVRKQFVKKFVLHEKLPYLCIVNQKELMT